MVPTAVGKEQIFDDLSTNHAMGTGIFFFKRDCYALAKLILLTFRELGVYTQIYGRLINHPVKTLLQVLP